MTTRLKTFGKWGLALVIAAFVISLATVAVFPDLNVEASAQSSGAWSSVLVIIALVIALLKQIISFIGFLTFAIKVLLVVAFVVVLIGVGLLAFRAMKGGGKTSDKG
jgi:hypothetical protein